MSAPQTSRIEAIFDEAVELPLEQRAAFLDRECGDDGELRRRVQRLLDADALNNDGTLHETLADFGQDHIPRQVGAYAVRALAGEGGMGAVYDAVHQPTGRRAAVKVVRAGISTARGRERLRIEAESLSRLSDPGIAQVYDAGVAEVTYPDGNRAHRPFIAMEFVDGTPIIDYVRRHKLPIDDRLRLIERVARAAHHAHQRGVIHRDLKPSNILITADGTPKIVDFGIARITDATAESITATGQVLGTVRYMSPEQAAGDQTKLDTRTDVYAIGAILYELLAERPLIELSTGSTLGAVVQVLKISPPRLDTIAPDIARDLVAIVHKAIEREPDHRYGSAQALADDLDRFIHGREVSARAPTTIERFVRVVKRNKPLSAAIAVAALAVIAGAGLSTYEAFVASHNAQIARREATAKAKALDEAQASLDYLTDLLGSATPEKLGRDARLIDVVTSGVSDLESRFKDQPLVVSTVQFALGRTFLSLGRYRDALKLLTESYQTRLKLLGPDDRLTVDSESAQHEAALSVGEGAEMNIDYERAPKWYEQHLGPENRQTLHARAVLASAYSQFDLHDSAIRVLQENYDIFRRVYGPEDPDTLDAAQTLGFYLAQRRGDAFGTIKLLRPVVQSETARYGADNARTLFSSLVLASAYQIAGQNDEALALLEPRMPAFLKVYGELHSHTIWAMRLMASCYRDAGKLEQAQAMFDRAIESGRKTFGDHDGRVQSTRVRLAEMWLEHGRTDEAEKLIRDVLHKELVIGVAGGNFAVTLTAEGRILLLHHRPADALVRFEGAMGAVTVGVRTDIRHPARAEVAYWMGLCLLDLDRPADAAMCLREAADTYALRCGESTDLTRRARDALARAEQAIAQHTGAPTTQPLVGYGIPADEITWFWRLSMVARDEQKPEAALQYAQLAVKYCTIREGKDAPRTRQMQSYLDELQAKKH